MNVPPESSPRLRVSERVFVQHGEGSGMTFYRLSVAVDCAPVLSSPAANVLPSVANALPPGSLTVTSCHNKHWARVGSRELDWTRVVVFVIKHTE